MIARLEQLGPFQFFFTLSCADKRWAETMTSIFQLKGHKIQWTFDNSIHDFNIQIDNIPLQEFLQDYNLHNLIKENVLLLTRSFDKRVTEFIKHIIMGTNSPMNIQYYNYRVEFQLRGAGHIHGVLWCDMQQLNEQYQGIPDIFTKLKEDQKLVNNEELMLVQFIDNFISCSLDTPIKEIVQEVQTHNHTKTCRKYQTNCRFGFPKFPSDKTIIAQKLRSTDFPNVAAYTKFKLQLTQNLKKVKETLIQIPKENLHMHTLQQILQESEITETDYYTSLKYFSSGTSIILKRKVTEIYINNYNEEWLQAWNANLDIQVCLDYFSVLTYITDYCNKNDAGTTEHLQKISKQCTKTDIKDKMHTLTQAFLSHRQIGESEAIYRIIPSLNLTKSNIKCVFLANGFPQSRYRFLQKITDNNTDTDRSNNFITIEGKEGNFILKSSIHEKYQHRPSNLKEICLVEFAMFYETSKGSTRAENNISSQPTNNTYIELSDTNKTKMKKREHANIIRYHQFKFDTEMHEYIYSELLFFYPWQTETELYSDNFDSCWNLFNDYFETIQSNKTKLYPHKNNIQKAREFMNKNPTNAADLLLDPAFEQQNLDDANLPQEPPENFTYLPDEFLDSTQQQIPEKTKFKPVDISNIDEMLASVQKLSYGQRFAFNLVLNYCKSLVKYKKSPEHPIDPPLLMIHGGAGTGKSKLINDITTWAEHTLTMDNERHLNQPYTIRVAPTGKAASIIEGLTLHSAFNFKFGNEFTSLSDQQRDNNRALLSYLQIVIVDEISMVKADMLYQLNLRLQEVKQNDKIFGGICVLLFGDNMQLKPILAKWIFEKPHSPTFSEYYNLNNLWSKFQIIELTKNHRQNEDGIYADILNRIRFGKQTDEDNLILLSRVTKIPPIDATYVFGSNYLVNNHNNKMLSTTPGDEFILHAKHIHPTNINYKPKINDNGQIGKTAFIDKLKLKLHSKIMLIHNIDTSDSLTNGTMGPIKDIIKNKDNIITHLLIDFGKTNIGQNARTANNHLLTNNQKHLTPITSITFSYSLGKPQKTHTTNVRLLQFPVKLAWATTAHKIQGQTIPKPNLLVADFQSIFAKGQAYVILSRIQSLQQLYLLNYTDTKIYTDPQALEEAKKMKQNAINIRTPYWLRNDDNHIRVISLNIRSLNKHHKDLQADFTVKKANFICLSETHLTPQHENNLNIDSYDLFTNSVGKGKGVAIYAQKNSNNHYKYSNKIHNITKFSA